jgi:putative transposase
MQRLSGRYPNFVKCWPAMATANTFSASLDEEVESWDIHVLRSPVRMPTATARCERLIGTIRRECLDYVIPLTSGHLRRNLREWVSHYNTGRPHRSLASSIADRTPVNEPTGSRTSRSPFLSHVIAEPILGGLRHEYRWEDAA